MVDADTSSYFSQKIIDYSPDNVLNYKVYDKGILLGYTQNKNNLYEGIKQWGFKASDKYEHDSISLSEDIYFVEEYSKFIYEDIDTKLLEYFIDNECYGILTTCVEFSNNEGIFDKIYILNSDDYYTAQSQFINNFISQDAINKINSGQIIASPTSYTSIETGVSIKETIEMTVGVGRPSEILQTTNEIYEYLCYGRNKERQYYTTKAGDTLNGVGYWFNNMSEKQIMMLNPDIIKDENQILEPGTVLNVTYYSSPITVVVNKERLTQEVIFPEKTLYVEDADLPRGASRIITPESNGVKKILYSETWANGVLQDGKEKSSEVLKAATQGIVHIGAGTVIPSTSAGSGNWRWPVKNPTITCDYTCYAGHGGVDFYNLYKPWDYVLAVDSGVVIDTGWTDIGGYYAKVDHNNGYITYYGHFSSLPYVTVGQAVTGGEILGPIGMTGNATGPHVHLAFYENNRLINPCSVLNCSLLY